MLERIAPDLQFPGSGLYEYPARIVHHRKRDALGEGCRRDDDPERRGRLGRGSQHDWRVKTQGDLPCCRFITKGQTRSLFRGRYDRRFPGKKFFVVSLQRKGGNGDIVPI